MKSVWTRPRPITCRLTPLSFLERSAAVYPNHVSAVYEGRSFTWAQTYERCRRFASYLVSKGIGTGDTVAAMLPNIPAMNELHFAVPMAGAVLNALNIRLDATSIAFQLDHGGAKIILVDPEFCGVISDALKTMSGPKPFVIDVDDAAFAGGKRIGAIEYEAAVAQGDPTFVGKRPGDEWDAIALSYTSGTTGNPKGVVTHHRGAYLNAVSNILAGGLGQHPVYLWTLPMFHCNGWCFPWTVAAAAGINVCLRKVDPAKIFALIREHGVTHMCGAPIVYNTLINAPDAPKGKSAKPVVGLIAGAAPPVAVLEGAESIGIRLTHVYGLTEVYGPASVCAEQPGWDDLPAAERAQFKRRQGVPYPLEEAVTVIDPQTMREVPRDGETIGEVMFRGNIVMKGYLKNEKATQGSLRRRLVPHRRSRRARRARLCHHQGPLQGHHHLRRREHLLGRGRGHPLQASGRAVRGCGRQARSEMGRSALRLHRAEGRRESDRGRDHRLLHAATCPASRRRRPWCSARSRRRRPARSRSICCATRCSRRRRFRPENFAVACPAAALRRRRGHKGSSIKKKGAGMKSTAHRAAIVLRVRGAARARCGQG